MADLQFQPTYNMLFLVFLHKLYRWDKIIALNESMREIVQQRSVCFLHITLNKAGIELPARGGGNSMLYGKIVQI